MKNVVSKVLMMFVMSFTLLVSCSYAAEFSTTGVTVSNYTKDSFSVSSGGYNITDDYSTVDVGSILGSYYSDNNEVSESIYNNMVQELQDAGYDFLVVDTGDELWSVMLKLATADLGYFNSHLYVFGTSIYIYNSAGAGSSCSSSSAAIHYAFDTSIIYSSFDVKSLTVLNNKAYWDGESYVYKTGSGGSSGGDSSIITPSVDLISSETFTSLVNDLTQSELFYQHVPVSHRKNYFVQYDTENDRYIFYFYPSNYFIQGLLMNENDYYLISSENFSWWDNVVNFVQGLFNKDNEESFDYNVVYATVSEEGNFDYWFRSKSNLILDKTLFNFELSPLVFSTSNINFFGKHGGGGIDIDTGEVTVATEPESSLQPNTFDENPIVLNNNPIHEYVDDEQSFWDKVVNKLSSITSGFNSLFSAISSIPEGIFKIVESKTGVGKILGFISPLAQLIIEILGLFITCVAFIGRAITFVYTWPTIEASSAIFVADVETTTKGLVFTGNNWGSHFLSGLDKLKAYSWNGITLWSFFEAFALALVVVIAIKLVRKHYHM